MVRELLNVIMDGIKDANMMIDYADEAYSESDETCGNWFKNHANERMQRLDTDYDFVCRQINLTEKANEGDELAEALKSHLDYQINDLKSSYSRI